MKKNILVISDETDNSTNHACLRCSITKNISVMDRIFFNFKKLVERN